MTKWRHVANALTIAMAMTIGGDAAAQKRPATSDGLRQQIERRFDVLPLRSGVALRPKSTVPGVRLIELADGTLAIDGAPVTGAELRQKLGSDADLVLRLSYLDPDARRALFGTTPSGPETTERPETLEPPPPPEPPQPSEPPAFPSRRMRQSEGRVRFGGSVTVDADETVSEVVVIGGSADIEGQVLRDVVVIGGVADIGPHAYVGRDITVVGGTIRRAPGARVRGRVNEVGPGFAFHELRWGRMLPFAPLFLWGSMWGGLFALVSTVTRLVVLSVLASIVLLLGRDYVERVGARAATEPIKAAIVGVLAQLLFLPLLIVTIIVLVITIVGIPLLVLIPFALLALAVVALIGFTAVASGVGRLVSTRLGSSQPNPYLSAIIGIIVMMSPVLLARIIGLGDGLVFPLTAALALIGFMAEYAAWTVGFGAVALSRFARPEG